MTTHAAAQQSIRDYALYGYQLAWLNDRSRFKIGMWSRQVGKTFVATLEISDDLVEAYVSGAPCKWVILSRGERQAREAIAQVTEHLKAYGQAFEELESDVDFEGNTYKQLEVRLAPNIWVIGLPANPDTARGYSANVYLDEFGIHKDSREIWKALFPIISAGWKIRVHSTPKGKGNKFYELMTADDGLWSRHVVDIYEAVKQGCPRDIEELRAGIADEDAWAQEFECQWLDEASAWLSYDMIMSCEHPEAGLPERYGGAPCFLGNDIAVRGDLWVTWVLEPVGDVLWTREIVGLKRKTFAAQDAVLDDLFNRYNVAQLNMDQTGMGEKPVEDAKRRYGQHRVNGVLFTAAAKLVLATALKQTFEDRKIRIPEGDIKLRADLHKVQKMVGPTGIPRFVAESDAAGHADRFWAGALATSGAVEVKTPWRPLDLSQSEKKAAGDDGFVRGAEVMNL